MSKYIVHTDGGSRGNPGPAAIGVIIEAELPNKRSSASMETAETELPSIRSSVSKSAASKLTRKEYGEYLGDRTNNQAEYEAVIFALKKLKQLVGSEKAGQATVEINLDSELLAKQLNGEYKVKEKEIQNLFLEVHNLRLDFGKVEFKHVLRGKNVEADKLVNQVLDRESNKLNL